MIISTILNALKAVITTVFGILPSIPGMPDSLKNGINSFINLIFDNTGLLNVFVPVSTIKIVIPIVVIIMNFDHIYKLTIWILKKIPMLGINS